MFFYTLISKLRFSSQKIVSVSGMHVRTDIFQFLRYSCFRMNIQILDDRSNVIVFLHVNFSEFVKNYRPFNLKYQLPFNIL